MSPCENPRVSVVLLVRRRSRTLPWVLDRLNGQTIAGEIECVVVTPTQEETAGITAGLGGLAGARILEVGEGESDGEAKAAGVHAAGAPLVAFLEDHSFPSDRWAEALAEAHDRGDYAVVGPVVKNANPASGASWGCFLVYYGQWMEALGQEELRHLPANHSCYRRDELLSCGERLPELLEAESVLHADLLRRGRRLYQEEGSEVYHLNYARASASASEYFFASRVFADERASGWSVFRRAVYACGSPLLPALRILRLLPLFRRARLEPPVLAAAFAGAFLTLCSGAAGELLGYALGAGSAKEALTRFVGERDGAFSARELAEAAELVQPRRQGLPRTGGGA